MPGDKSLYARIMFFTAIKKGEKAPGARCTGEKNIH